ncbi:MAG TPA: hypothetical protein VKE93_03175 [Candidatus Angelobacter sp.]|nr:hypothetical protein [Candidatus Angelobacter sp.]
MSSFQPNTPPEDSSEARPALSRVALPPMVRSHGGAIALALVVLIVLAYGLHERSVAAHLSQQSLAASAQLQDARAQIGALNSKLDAATATAVRPDLPTVSAPRHAVVTRAKVQQPKPDPRWKKVQAQLDAQGKDIEATRQEIASARSDLEGSIARTHDELVVLQKKGERNYYEFDLDKSKNFHTSGPVGISLRKANTKHEYADLELLVDDRQLSKKHLNLYEPVIFYPSEERQAVELVINSISKNHIHGYISAAKYKASELAQSSAPSPTTNAPQEPPAVKARHKLEAPK